jgi:hypothetical protein
MSSGRTGSGPKALASPFRLDVRFGTKATFEGGPVSAPEAVVRALAKVHYRGRGVIEKTRADDLDLARNSKAANALKFVLIREFDKFNIGWQFPPDVDRMCVRTVPPR